MMSEDRGSVRLDLLPDKIRSGHRERLAIVYIRQSTPQQIERHQESTRLQYALVERAVHFGWPRERVVVIDDDLGRTGKTVEGRIGFQRLVAEVSLGHVGLVLGIEMSRLARSCRDWHQLLEICALFDTLIADPEGVYDPGGCYNDRLLLDLKATMSEAELHILEARMLDARMAKARRGELGKPVPMGYVRRPCGEIVLDPDEQAQATIRLVFDLYERFGTIGKVLRHLADHGIRMPVRAPGGENKGNSNGGGLTGHRSIACWSTRSTPAHTSMACARPIAVGRGRGIPRRGARPPISTTPPSFCRIACRPTSAGTSTRRTRPGCARMRPG